MNLFDACGVPLSNGSPAAIDRHEAAIGMLLGRPGDPQGAIAAALAEDPGFVMGHCLRAAWLVLSADEVMEPALRECIAAAEGLASRANDRERGHIAAARAWLERDFQRATRLYGEVLIDYPRDRLALRVALFGDFFLGQQNMLRDRVAQVLPHWDESVPGYGYVLGMYAFGLEETALYAQAEDTARRALELDRPNPSAIHAIAHVMEMRGRQREGIAWLKETAAQWDQGNGSATHFWWHLALFHLDLNEVSSALDIYDAHIARPGMPLSSLADASALLWRLHLRGVSLGGRWRELAGQWADRRLRAYCPFYDLHAMVAFIGTGDAAHVEESLQVLRDRAASDDPGARRVRDISLPIANAFAAFGKGDYGAAIEALGEIRLIDHGIGGSHAQRDALDLTLIEAALRHREVRLARALAAERTALKPSSAFNRALARRAQTGLGLAA